MLKHSIKYKARYYMRHTAVHSPAPQAVCAWVGARKFGFIFSQHHLSLKVLKLSYNQAPQMETQIYCQLNSTDIQSYLWPHPKFWPHKAFFPLFVLSKEKGAWSMNIYRHDLWSVSRFEDKMLVFQASRLNISQTKTELYSKANMRNKLLHSIIARFIFMS